MKQILIASLTLILFSLQTALGQDKGYLTITQSETATTAVYDGAVVKLKEAGVWELGWTFHALGALQPTGLLSIGIFPDRAALENRVAQTDRVFSANNISVPAPRVFEIYNIVRGPAPAEQAAGAILIYFEPPVMTPEQYASITAELEKAGQLNNPGRLFHVAFKTDDGHLNVIDIWASAEQFQAFGGTLIPILEKTFGSAPQPAVYGLHNSLGW